jgi:hypothetical protein
MSISMAATSTIFTFQVGIGRICISLLVRPLSAAKVPRGCTAHCALRHDSGMNPFFCRQARWIQLLLMALVASHAGVTLALADPAETLREQHAALAQQLRESPFARPLVLKSHQQGDRLSSEIHAVLPYPYAQLRAALEDPGRWCAMLLLNIKTIDCRLATDQAGPLLGVFVGRTGAEDPAQAFRLDFGYRPSASGAHYLDIGLQAPDGPTGTRDYRFRIEAIELSGQRSFVHMTYSYAFNTVGRLAMLTYLATLGRDKVGFTRSQDTAAGLDGFIGGLRGLAERNAMRYFLAVDAYLQADGTGTPAAERERRLQNWFSASERYPRQLHEVDLATYLDMKRAQVQRQGLPD